MEVNRLTQIIIQTLEDNKASDIRELDVTALTYMTDYMIIGSAISTRHINALRDKVIVALKAAGERPLCVDGEGDSGWILIDLQEIVIHIMLPETRDFYSLEKLWSMTKVTRKTEVR